MIIKEITNFLFSGEAGGRRGGGVALAGKGIFLYRLYGFFGRLVWKVGFGNQT
jgi:hypothetical protein